MKDSDTIYGILRKICSSRKRMSCKLKCCYSDGMACSIFSIEFFQNQGKTSGRIFFQGETGRVLKCFYKGLRFENKTQIIDLLLDLYNHERNCLEPI